MNDIMDWEVQEGPDIELSNALSVFSQEADFIKSLMQELDGLLIDFRFHSMANRGVNDSRYILSKLKQVKRMIELFDRSNSENVQWETADDRMRVIVANSLRLKLQKSMTQFQGIRNTVASEHKELLEKAADEITTRHREIEELHHTMVELQDLFEELSVFACCNDEMNSVEKMLEITATEVSRGVKRLQSAEKSRPWWYRPSIILFGLFVLIKVVNVKPR